MWLLRLIRIQRTFSDRGNDTCSMQYESGVPLEHVESDLYSKDIYFANNDNTQERMSSITEDDRTQNNNHTLDKSRIFEEV